jgi:hypothetical protein
MRKLVAISATVLALGVPATAVGQTDPDNPPDVNGHITKKEARVFQRQYFPKVAPTLLLKDKRANFFFARRVSINKTVRVNPYTVDTRFNIVLHPDKAHRRAHWFPIRCKGWNRAQRLVKGNIGGSVRDYVCKTILPK